MIPYLCCCHRRHRRWCDCCSCCWRCCVITAYLIVVVSIVVVASDVIAVENKRKKRDEGWLLICLSVIVVAVVAVDAVIMVVIINLGKLLGVVELRCVTSSEVVSFCSERFSRSPSQSKSANFFSNPPNNRVRFDLLLFGVFIKKSADFGWLTDVNPPTGYGKYQKVERV